MFALRYLAAIALTAATVVACSSDDTSSNTSSSSGGASSSSTSSTSSSGGSSSATGGACQGSSDCPKLTCTCGGFAGAEVQKCDNGKCAASCSEAGC